MLYLTVDQAARRTMSLLLRTTNTSSLAVALRGVVSAVDPWLPPPSIFEIEQLIRGTMAARRFAGAIMLTDSLSGLLFGVEPTDPRTFVGVALLLATVGVAASLFPAWSAMRADPMVALHRAD